MKSRVQFQNQAVCELKTGEDRVLVSPEHGARLLQWTRREREVVHWPGDADWTKILKVRGGDPVLFPFVARHFVDGVNERWRDGNGVVRTMPQHGFARDAAFDVVEQEEAHLRLRLTDSAETQAFYPFAFQFDVVFTLRASSHLEIRFETTNRGEKPMPYYAGHHFYLAIPHEERGQWMLHIPCTSWGRQAPDGSIVREAATAENLRLDDPTLIDRFQIEPRASQLILDNTTSGRRLGMKMLAGEALVPWYAVTTWTERADSDFYCIEPWLGLPNAIHHGEGLRHIAPGGSEAAAVVLDAGNW